MKYLKSISTFEGYIQTGYEFVKDVFQELEDDGYSIDVLSDSQGVVVLINKVEYKTDGETVSRHLYFDVSAILPLLNFAIGYLGDEYHMSFKGGSSSENGEDIIPSDIPLVMPTFKNKSGKYIPKLSRQIQLKFSYPLRKLESYQVFESSGHWKDDILPKLNWSRVDELYDMLLEFEDLGWRLPAKDPQTTSLYSFSGIPVSIKDESFNEPSKKLDLLHREYYKSYRLWIINSQRTANYDIAFFKEMVDLLTKLEGFNYKYKISEVSKDSVKIDVYNEDDVFDPSIIIKDMKKAKVKVSIGIDNAIDRLNNHLKIMNIEKVDNKKIFVTQKVDKYDLDKIYDILFKTLNKNTDKFNIIKDYDNDRVVVATKGKWI